MTSVIDQSHSVGQAHLPDIPSLVQQVEALTAQVQACSMMALVAQNTDNAVIVTDARGRVEWVNDSFCRLTGYAFAELQGRTPGAVLQTQETDPATIAYIRERISLGLPFEAVILNRRKDGATYWARIESKPLRDEFGRINRFMAVQRDITAQKRTEARLDLHHAVVQLLSDASEIGGLLPSLLKLIGNYLGWPVGVAWEVKGKRWVGDVNMRSAALWSSNELRYAGFLAATEKAAWHKGEGFLGGVWQSKQLTFVHDLHSVRDHLRGVQADKEGLQGALVLPILSGERVTFLLEFTGPRMDPPDAELLQFLEGVCIQVSHFIDRKRDEMRLRQFMTEFDSLFKLSPDGFVVFNSEGIRSYGNPAFYTMTGLTRERLDGVTESEFDCHPGRPMRARACPQIDCRRCSIQRLRSTAIGAAKAGCFAAISQGHV